MRIESGLFDHMVLQRNGRGVCDAVIEGTAQANGPVLCRARHKGKVAAGMDWKKIGSAEGGRFEAKLTGLKAGGPYQIELNIDGSKEKLAIGDVLVGDVWIAGGQSNMQGCGLRQDAARPVNSVRAFFMDDRWGVAADPIHNMWECVDQCHVDICGGARPEVNKNEGVGPAVAFAQEMHRRSGIPQGILACGHNGTSMSQWNPALVESGKSCLYGATIRRVKKNGGRVAGLVWYQGESDANTNDAKLYTQRMKLFVDALRRDCQEAQLPVAMVQISRVIYKWDPDCWNEIQEHQRQLPRTIKHLAVVPAIDLRMDDGIHISGADQQKLGARLAEAMASVLGMKKTTPPIELKRITVRPQKPTGNAQIVVEYDNVVSELRPTDARALGYTVLDLDGLPAMFDSYVEGNKAILRTQMKPMEASMAVVYYGRGSDPACNVTDAAGRSVPVFGPIALGERTTTPFARAFDISEFQPDAGNLKTLQYPADPSALGFKQRVFPDKFANLHPELAARGPVSVVVYYRAAFTCAENMKLAGILGYDGPIKAWLDGKEWFADPNGTNPANADDKTIPFEAEAGRHELLIALSSNGGKAWGIFLRLQRKEGGVLPVWEE